MLRDHRDAQVFVNKTLEDGQVKQDLHLGEILLIGATLCGAWLAIGTELLSALHALTPLGVILFWVSSAAIGISVKILVLRPRKYLHKFSLGQILAQLKQDRISFAVLAILIIISLVLLSVALISPPNTNDSLQYHMARVAYWAQQGSLDFYTTPIPRQLWMPPWAEWAVLHLYLLAGSDRLVNLVQWLAMVGSLGVSALLTRRMSNDLSPRAAILAALFCATLPMGALQATSTQTDYVTAFWLICLAYWTVVAHQIYPRGERLTTVQWISLVCAVGLGMLTKGTYYAFAAPFLLWLLVSMLRAPVTKNRLAEIKSTWVNKISSIAGAVIICTGIIVILNAGTWIRNLDAYGFPLGPRTSVSNLSNEIFTPSSLISNLIRNATLHLATPYGVVNGPIRQAVEQIHTWIGLDPSDPRTSLDDYRVKRSRHEDHAGNFWHFIVIGVGYLFIACNLLLATRHMKKSTTEKPSNINSLIAVYALALFTSYLLFSLLYKWQPTGSRLQLPMFVVAAPLVGFIFSQPINQARLPKSNPSNFSVYLRRHAFFIIISAILLLAGYPSILSNPSRPLIVDHASAVDHSILTVPRRDLLFINTETYAPGYLSLAEAVASSDSCDRVGLILDSHNPAYPFWALQQPIYDIPNSRPITWIYLDDASGEIVPSPEQPCAVVCTICQQSQISIPSVGDFIAESIHFGGFIFYLSVNEG